MIPLDLGCSNFHEVLYHTSGFKTETMYDYYIVMESMFLVVKLSSHPIIGYASLTILLPWTTHKQHQNYSKTKSFFQNQNFNSYKLGIHTITLYKNEGVSQGHKHFLKLHKKLPKTYPPHNSPNNQKKTKSHVSPRDFTINHKEQHHMVSPCDSTINHKQTTSHGSPCDSIINHKQTTSHGAYDISQCIMESYIQLTPLNNYLSNCVIKLHMKLLTPNLPLSSCVIKLHIKLQFRCHSHTSHLL